MAHSRSIANEFLRRASRDDKNLTQMQLQKLVYIAHGWNLAINGHPLTDDSLQAWDYGPVYPELWESLRFYGKEPVSRPIMTSDLPVYGFCDDDEEATEVTDKLSEYEIEVIDRVYQVYGNFRAFKLSALTHEDNTPWHQVFVKENNKRGPIPDELIRDHFIELARQRKPSD